MPVVFGGNRQQDFFDGFITLFAAPRHDGWTQQRPFFPTRNARANKVYALRFQLFLTIGGIFVMGIAAIHDDIPGVEQWL